MNKKVSLGIAAVFSVLALIGGATGLQLFPFVVFICLALLDIFSDKKYGAWILILSIVMVFVNFGYSSWIDVGAWIVMLIPWLKR